MIIARQRIGAARRAVRVGVRWLASAAVRAKAAAATAAAAASQKRMHGSARPRRAGHDRCAVRGRRLGATQLR
jgi:hypothetical protein